MNSVLLAQLLGHIPNPTMANPDYYTLGYAKKYGVPSPYNSIESYQQSGGHLTDEFKLPNHMTFSNESIYSAPDIQGGQWQRGGQDQWNFDASQLNLDEHTKQALIDYFKNYEKGNTVTFPVEKRK